MIVFFKYFFKFYLLILLKNSFYFLDINTDGTANETVKLATTTNFEQITESDTVNSHLLSNLETGGTTFSRILVDYSESELTPKDDTIQQMLKNFQDENRSKTK